ncbi:hypothetical protein I532_12469 [Brevibacillus borstelensis AK1]|uniref:Uncharacterized protein n=1 Tax=Brevibacillus borstelensis AK1 TaxID=1300222 RepID=M8D875_9BACL|nr:hypothetical protein I532_12469 [Brevibacillus borstelensis AK1]
MGHHPGGMEKAEHAFSVQLLRNFLETATFGRGSAFGMEPASESPHAVSHRTCSRFLLFHLLHQSPSNRNKQNNVLPNETNKKAGTMHAANSMHA